MLDIEKNCLNQYQEVDQEIKQHKAEFLSTLDELVVSIKKCFHEAELKYWPDPETETFEDLNKRDAL